MRGSIGAAYGEAMSSVGYDEFAFFADNAAEVGLAYSGPPTVARVEVEVATGPRR